MQVNMHEAKSQLSRLGELACQGERVIIAKAGKPYLELLPYKEKKEPRVRADTRASSVSTSNSPTKSWSRCSGKTSSGLRGTMSRQTSSGRNEAAARFAHAVVVAERRPPVGEGNL